MMDRFNEWAKTCLNKKKYSEFIADNVMDRRKNESGVELFKYFCPHCSH